MAVRYCSMGSRGGQIKSTRPPEAGATIAGSVGKGAANSRSDVMVVQTLLNLLAASQGGPTPPLTVDGIAGNLTNAAISRFQSVNLGFSDGRVDPGGKTLARLNVLVPPDKLTSASGGISQAAPPPSSSSGARAFLVSTAPSASSSAAPPVGAPPAAPAKPAPLAAAIAATPTAVMWNAAARAHLGTLQQGLNLSGGIILLPATFTIVNTHFHLDRDPKSLMTNLGRALQVFNRIGVMLSDPNRFYREAPETKTSKFADAPAGGFSMPEPNNHITIRTQYPDCGPLCQAAMLIHEGAHFCGGPNEILHIAHEFPIPNGTPQDGSSHDYASMTADESLKNASSYAAFAIHAFFFQDLRFGLDKKSQ